MARTSDFITEARKHSKALVDAYQGLKALQFEATALDYSNSLPDGIGATDGITKTQTIAVVFTTTDALTTFMGQGHSTNLAKLL